MGPKYIFVTGGVVSSLGKGVAAASIGCLLESRGLRVTLQKCDPYLNVDPGTMSPYQHGEVYVTEDGAETDLDLGYYEPFTHAQLTRDHNWTTGRIYESIITKERRGDYLGKTVQVIPHVTDEIKAAFRKVSGGMDVVIVEIGGTVGDIESLPFLEAIRQMRLELGAENTLFVHVTLVPFIATARELKTKPTQHSVKEMLSIGIQLEDAYKSLREALVHGGLAHSRRTVLEWIEAEEIDSLQTAEARLRHVDGILVPGGFGKRGIQGMIHAIQYARGNKVPFFGICLGMQCATIEYARNVSGLTQADSTEFDPQTPHRVIYKLRELLGVDEMGGTMRLGAWPCKLEPGSFAARAYGKLEISERHRHRYEFNCDYEKALVGAGLRITGRTPDGTYVEIVEAPEHPWFLGCQFHPEFKSKPLEPHPLFAAFIGAAIEHMSRPKTAPVREERPGRTVGVAPHATA